MPLRKTENRPHLDIAMPVSPEGVVQKPPAACGRRKHCLKGNVKISPMPDCFCQACNDNIGRFRLCKVPERIAPGRSASFLSDMR